MAELLFGVETEYAISGVSSSATAGTANPGAAIDREAIVMRLLELARRQLIQLPDLNSSNSIFLRNGGRFYIDCGLHPELCTPEVTNPWDAVRYIQAGHRVLAGLAASFEAAAAPGTQVMCFRGNVDYTSGATWGCHESYMHRMTLESLQPQLIPHLVTRLIYTGAGGFNPLARGLEFTLSPRMAHVRRVITESSTSERGIWHTKSEPLCSGYRRLHVLCGESLCSETATFLKLGVTALIVAMADAGVNPGSKVQLADPLAALHTIAGDVTCQSALLMEDGSLLTAIEIQRRYLEMAEAHASDAFMPPWAAEVCIRWRRILHQLEGAPHSVSKTLDWGIKHALYANHARSLGIRWNDLDFWNELISELSLSLVLREGRGSATPLETAVAPRRRRLKEVSALDPRLEARGVKWEDLRKLLASRQKFHEIDVRFGQLGPLGIFEALDQTGVLDHRIAAPWAGKMVSIEHAVEEPPIGSRARLRGQVIQRLAGHGNARADWQRIVNYNDNKVLDLTDPFTSKEAWRSIQSAELPEAQLRRRLSEVFARESGSNARDPYERRQDAADRILSGDFAGAEELLNGLLAERFALPSTNCHMARVYLMTGREPQARQQIDLAWSIEQNAPHYVWCRILFFKCIFAIFDGQDYSPLIAQIKARLISESAHLDWIILPMLDHLRPSLGEPDYEFLKALAEALSDSRNLRQLEAYPQWINAELVTS